MYRQVWLIRGNETHGEGDNWHGAPAEKKRQNLERRNFLSEVEGISQTATRTSQKELVHIFGSKYIDSTCAKK